MNLETTRILLRNFTEKDLEDLHEYCSQVGVGEMAGWKHHESISESMKLLKNNIENTNIFAIEYKEQAKVIGYIAINKDSESGRLDTKELGFALNSKHQRQGIMSEAVYLILQKLFFEDNISYVYSCCIQNNVASKHLIEKMGFSFEQEGFFTSKSLCKTFNSFEYVYKKVDWKNHVNYINY